MALLLLLAAGFCVLLALPSKQPHHAELSSTGQEIPSAYSPEVEKLVNKHLFLTSQEQEWAQKKMKAENSFSAPAIGASILQKKNGGVDHSADQNENAAINDLDRYRKQLNYTNPEEVVQGQLQDQQKQRVYDEVYKKEFARQFIENARQHGFNVKLNDDLVVISVTPILQPTFQTPEARQPSSQQAH